MPDDSILRRPRAQQTLLEKDELPDPASLAILAVVADESLIFALQIALAYRLKGQQVKYEESRAYVVELLGGHPDFLAICGYDDVRIQEHLDTFLALVEHRWREVWWGREIPLDPGFPIPRTAKRSPDSPWIPQRNGAWLPDLAAAPALTLSQRHKALGPLMRDLARQDAQERGEPFRSQGRPTGTMPAAEFYAALARGLTACSGQRLTQGALARKAGMATNTLRHYLDAYGPPWLLLKSCRSLARCEEQGWKRCR